MSEDTFTCAACGGTFEKACSDEDALAEKDQLWPDVPIEQCVIICHDCFTAMRAANGPA